jgi:toxin ParE1/3/4
VTWPTRARVLPRARADLEEIVDGRIAAEPEGRPDERFLAGVRRALLLLLEHPRSGARAGIRRSGLTRVRFWPVPGFQNHLISYRPNGTGIEIIRVLYGARDWVGLLTRSRRRRGGRGAGDRR